MLETRLVHCIPQRTTQRKVRTMARYSTRKDGAAARQATLAARQARAVKRGASVTRGGRTVVRKDGGR